MATNYMNMWLEPTVGTYSILITYTLENIQYALYSSMCSTNPQLLQTFMK